MRFICNKLPLHEASRYNPRDSYFVIGGNPDECGGGIIGSARTLDEANELRDTALKLNYAGVRVRTWSEMQ